MKHLTGYLFLLIAFFVLLLASKTQAIFASEVEIKNNLFRTGVLNISATPSESLFTASNLKPGDSIESELLLANTGTIPSLASISVKKSAGFKALFETIQLEIKREEQTIYSGKLSDLINISLFETALAPSNQQSFRFKATLPADATSTLDNLYVNTTFVIQAVSGV